MEKKFTRLTASERDEISILLKRRYTHEEIADALGRNQSAISREIRRNKVKEVYDSQKAQHKAYVRTHHARWQFSKIRNTPELERYIIAGLRQRLPPEAISGRMRREHQPWYASKTAIYAWLYSVWGIRHYRLLLSRRWARRKRKGKKRPRVLIPNRVSIHARKGMTRRDYEGDTIVSSLNTVSLVTLYNPATMYMDARKVSNLKPSVVRRAFRSMLRRVSARSLTLDNGQENRLHMGLGVKTYFCDPYASWQKPGIENANKLLRRDIRKGSDIAQYPHQFIASLVARWNDTPRKKLKWRTPNEVMKGSHLFRNKKSA